MRPIPTLFASLILSILLGGTAIAEIVTKAVEYPSGDTTCIGYLAYDDSIPAGELRPIVMVIHEWYGLNDYAKKRTEDIAALGYIGFGVDMYGNGTYGTTREEAGALAGSIRSNPELRNERLSAAYAAARGLPGSDNSKIGVMGYCFGGGMSLYAAYIGMPISGLVSFHGSLPVPADDEIGNVDMPVLICHGQEDPIETLEEFKRVMAENNVDLTFIEYANAKHGFTNPDNDTDDPASRVNYVPEADYRSWEHMKAFWAELFGM